MTVTSVNNAVDAADKTVTVSGAVTASGVTAPAAVTLTIGDDDTRGVTVSGPTLAVTEGGTGSYTVVLDSEPTASVTVTPSSSDNVDVTVSAALTFATTNWNTAQTVTVTAAQDTDDLEDSATVSHAVAGGDYDTVTAAGVTVTVNDDDTVDTTPPRVNSIVRHDPASTPTNADTLIWRVTFSEPVTGVDTADFTMLRTTAAATLVSPVTGTMGAAYDVTASGGDLANLNDTVTLSFVSGHGIADAASNDLSNTTPTGTNHTSYVLDNTAPTVTITDVPSASNAAFTATFTFLEPVTGFALADIVLGNATASNFVVTSTTVYTALITPTASAVTVDVPVDAAQDLAGNGNTAAARASSTYTENVTDTGGGGGGGARANAAPEFPSPTVTRGIPENTAAGADIGAPIAAATDADGDALSYSLEGADAASFAFDAATRQLRTLAALDHETTDSYSVTVTADDGRGGTDTVEVTIDVADVDEPPVAPAVQMAAAAEVTSLMVSWTAPANAGPPITDYDYRYRVKTPPGPWTEVTDTRITELSATITELMENTEYEVQVRANNAEGEGVWSVTVSASTVAPANTAPEFPSGTVTRGIPENTAAGADIGAPIAAATDADGDALRYSLEGADAASFAFDAATRQLRTLAALDHETTDSYSVTVTADDGRDGTDTVEVTIDVADVDEPPVAPAVQMAAAAEVTSLTVSWAAPANAGPPITDYDYRYRVKNPPGPWTEVTDTRITELSATITELMENTEYEVQIRANNAEGEGVWSVTVSASTIAPANTAPEFPSDAVTRSVPENTAAGTDIGAPIAAATDADGDVLSYRLEGADAASFAFDAATRQFMTLAALDHETTDSYSVTVTADDGRGGTDTVEVTINVTDLDEQGPAQGWLTRFGRTASDNAVRAIENRWRGERIANEASHLTLGGRQLNRLFNWGGKERTAGAVSGEALLLQPDDERFQAMGRQGFTVSERSGAGHSGSGHSGGTAPDSRMGLAGGALPGAAGAAPGSRMGLAGSTLPGPARGAGVSRQLPDLKDVLLGSSFFYSQSLNSAGGRQASPGRWSVWGDVAGTRFDGRDGSLSLDGEVTTGTLGADLHRGQWLSGLALSYSEGEGSYREAGAGEGALRTALTSVHPFVRYEHNERTSFWGVLGYGSGDLMFRPAAGGSERSGDLTTTMAALGGRGVLSRAAGGFELAIRSDARMTETESDSTMALMGGSGSTSRLRLLLEGTGSRALDSGAALSATLEGGLRYDGGDAETGGGLELGAGLGYASGRFVLQLNARALGAHEDEAYEEWGLSGSALYRALADGSGLSLRFGSAWGVTESSVDSLWSRRDARGLARGGMAMDAAQRYETEIGYGFAGARSATMWRPYFAAQVAGEGVQMLRLGLLLRSRDAFEASLEFGQRFSLRGEEPENALILRGAYTW